MIQTENVGWVTVVVGEAQPSEWGLVERWTDTARAVQTLAGTVVTVGHMAPGSSGTADFSIHNLSVISIGFAIKSDASAGTIGEVIISVDENTVIPEGTQAPSGITYRYFGVDTAGVPSQNISQAVITIKVEKSWVESEKIDLDSLRVLRLGVSWDELTTEQFNEDQTYYYYKAYSPGFSLFAVVGQLRVEKPQIVTAIQIVPPAVTTGPTQMRPPVELFAAIGAVGVVVGVMAYRRSSAFRYNSMLKQFKTIPTRAEYVSARPGLEKIRRKIRGARKVSLMKTAGALWKRPAAPGLVPVRKRLTKPELLAVKRLEKFIKARREEAPTFVGKKNLAKIRSRMGKEEVALRRLERFMEKRREAVRIPKRKKSKK
jgi:PGF-pre-PGF domain-containing protein